MAISLVKGQKVDIGLKKVGVGLGWDPNKAAGGADYDLDASAFMLNANKKAPSEQHFVFYNNLRSPDGSVQSMGDDRTGGSSEGDDETITVDLLSIDKEVQEIIFVVSIDKAEERKQNFGQVSNSFIRIYDATSNAELCKYELGEDFSIETCIEFGRLYRRDNQWRFEAMGNGVKTGLQGLITKYV